MKCVHMAVAGTRPSFSEPMVRNISSQCGVIRSSLTHCRAKLLSCAVIGMGIDASEAGTADVREPRTEEVAEQAE